MLAGVAGVVASGVDIADRFGVLVTDGLLVFLAEPCEAAFLRDGVVAAGRLPEPVVRDIEADCAKSNTRGSLFRSSAPGQPAAAAAAVGLLF